MHLVSQRDQEVDISGFRFQFAKGESIHTEDSRKFSRPSVQAMAKEVGLDIREWWTDRQEYFAMALLQRLD